MSSHLPATRVKTIMKSSAEVDVVSQDSLLLVTRATELFIKHLANEAVKVSDGKKLEYNNLAEIVHQTEKLDFLAEIMPKKISVRQFREIMAKKARRQFSSSDSSDSESSSESEDEKEKD